MKRIVCIFIIVLIGAAVTEDSWGESTLTNENAYLAAVVDISEIRNVGGLVDQLLRQHGITVCFECSLAESEGTDTRIKLGDSQHRTIRGIIEGLSSKGYICKMYNNTLSICTTAAFEIVDNPMNKEYDGFFFSGSRRDFAQRLSDEGIHVIAINIPARQLIINRRVDVELSKDIASYNLNINGRVTLRDILLRIASKYGYGWYVEIAEKEKTWETENDDGVMQHIWGGKMFLTYFDEMEWLASYCDSKTNNAVQN